MAKIRKDSIKLLKKLEKIFPGDDIISNKVIFRLGGTLKILSLLEQKNLIEKSKYKIIGLPNQETHKIEGYSLTSFGLELLNGLKQQRTNLLLVILTILLFIIGIIQILK